MTSDRTASVIQRAAVRDGRTLDGEPDFAPIGVPIMDEKLIDTLYRMYFDLMSEDGWRADRDRTSLADIAAVYNHGIYLPVCERIVFTSEVDTKNFDLPDYASIVKFRNGPAQFISVYKIGKLPRGHVSALHGAAYKCTIMYKETADKKSMEVYSIYLVVSAAGKVMVARDSHGYYGADNIAALGYWTFIATVAINAADDARHLWQVRTAEPLIFSNSRGTPLVLGCEVERIKSLFYARETPLTAANRKRPIMHWVEAHERRMKNGIDIDVRKHLRGIERFEMGSFAFEITNPRKERKA